MSDQLLVEGRLCVDQGWKLNRRMEEGRDVGKLSEFNVTTIAAEFQQILMEKYDNECERAKPVES